MKRFLKLFLGVMGFFLGFAWVLFTALASIYFGSNGQVFLSGAMGGVCLVSFSAFLALLMLPLEVR